MGFSGDFLLGSRGFGGIFDVLAGSGKFFIDYPFDFTQDRLIIDC